MLDMVRGLYCKVLLKFSVFFLIALVLSLPCLTAKVPLNPHDMRMENFKISRHEWNKKESNYSLRFGRAGEVTKANDDHDETSRTCKKTRGTAVKSPSGRWSLSPSGRVTFSLKENGVIERYSAEFQLNPFGDSPRMVKGTVVKDNVRWGVKNLFRRVTASFSAEGQGEDTLDTSYQSRPQL